ncbi:MAG: bifunctional DNA primase/polymerase [Desulfovibrio sp.]|jgi:hypothetical protein|nr:bifunctional DNA primase/polymerase [Desulfovibrio sp.]
MHLQRPRLRRGYLGNSAPDDFPEAFSGEFHRELESCVEMVDAALVYAWAGISVFPCGPDKKPLIKGGFKKATTEGYVLREWWGQHKGAMIGVPTGGTFWVLDLDGEEGAASFETLSAEHGPLPATWTVSTPRGRHFYFLTPPDGKGPRNSAGRIAPGVDVRGRGGYVIGPPSENAQGQKYLVTDTSPITVAPAWLLDLARARKAEPAAPAPRPRPGRPPLTELHPYVAAALKDEMAKIAGLPPRPSRRNDQLFNSVCQLAGFVATNLLPEGELSRCAEKAFRECHPDDFDPKEFASTFASALAAGMKTPREIPANRPWDGRDEECS